MKEKSSIYVTKNLVNCGPCGFINLTNMKGSKKLENELAKIKLKPFKATDYSSFLVLADKYKKDVVAYVASKKLNNKMFELMFYYEKIPKNKQAEYKKRANDLFYARNKKYKNRIKYLRQPLRKLDDLLKRGYRIAFLICDYYLNKLRDPVPHWIVAYKKFRSKYYFMDPARNNGKTNLTKLQLLKGIKLNKKMGYYPVLVAYKEK